MADAGLEIINDYGSTLIDSTWANLSFIQKGTVTVGSNTANEGIAGGVTLAANPRGQIPLVFISCSGFVNIQPVTPTSFGYRLAKGVLSFNWFAFAAPPITPAAHGQGLQVFDADGKCIFDSAYQYLRIRELAAAAGAVLNMPTSGGVSNIESYAMSSTSANRAFCFASPGYVVQAISGGGVSGGFTWRNIAVIGGRFNGSKVEAAAFQSIADLTPPGGSSVNTSAGKFPSPAIIIDTTGL